MDIYSRYAFVFPLKDKKGSTIIKCFKELKNYGRNLWIDKGGEFLNNEFKKFCKDNNINIYHTYGDSKAVYIERFNRTLKQRINNYFIENNTNKYIDVLDNIVEEYNNTKHSTTKQTPYDVYYNNEEPAVTYFTGGSEKPKSKVGDYVRIRGIKGTFEKDMLKNGVKKYSKLLELISNKTLLCINWKTNYKNG
jgi:hypothetical protein